MRYTPPSGFLLKMGPAACMSWRWHITLQAQHCIVSQHIPWGRDHYFIPFLVGQGIQVFEVREPGPACVCDNDIKPAQLVHCLLNDARIVLGTSGILQMSDRLLPMLIAAPTPLIENALTPSFSHVSTTCLALSSAETKLTMTLAPS
jgi:hypothetical protein